MVVGLYLTTFLASALVSLTLLIKHKRTLTVAILFSLLITVNSYGRYLGAVSSTFETARLGNLMVYTGGCFSPLLVVKILDQISHTKIPKWISVFMLLYSCLIYGLVMTVGHSGIYYKSCWLAHGNGFQYLGKVYGPAHILFPVMLIMYLAIMIGQTIYAFRKRKEISSRTVTAVVGFTGVIVLGYAIEKILHSHINYLSIGYLLSQIFFLRLIERINMYDLPSNIANSIDEMKEYGYIEFDDKYRVMGYNTRSKELFPEIEEKWTIDKKPPQDGGFLYREVILWMYCRKENEKKTIQVGDRYYEMFVRNIPYFKNPCIGYMLEIIDRTGEMKYMAAIENYNENLEKEVEKKTQKISFIKDSMVVGMASMVESRDNSTGDHIKRTYQVMKVFARHLLAYREQLGITREYLGMVVRAAPMHDLGKIAVDDAVLRKQGKFTPEEYEKMKKHPEEGAKIVREILTGVENDVFVEIAVNVAHYHHEKWNGQGYPCGLKGTEIPLEARLMALADVFEALVSKRCYKDAYSYDRAFSIIEESLGSHFDPVLGKLFIECRSAMESMYTQWMQNDGDNHALRLEEKELSPLP